jgi:uncharacterized protein YecT (DUF1311 family)
MVVRLAASLTATFSAACLSSVALVTAALAAPIDCSKAQSDVEHSICSRQDLLARDKAIAERLAALGQRCPASKPLLRQGQRFWLRDRWDCRNGEGALEPDGSLAACLAERMGRRLQDLNGVAQGCDLSSLTASYRWVDTGYLKRFSQAHVGKTVSVFGSMKLDACRKTGADATRGAIVGEPASVRFPVRFSVMPALKKEFLCARYPAAHWRGIVRDDGDGAYLYLSDILGDKLDE